MGRIFWVACPSCRQRFYCEWELRTAGVHLICPACKHRFLPDDSPERDERWFAD